MDCETATYPAACRAAGFKCRGRRWCARRTARAVRHRSDHLRPAPPARARQSPQHCAESHRRRLWPPTRLGVVCPGHRVLLFWGGEALPLHLSQPLRWPPGPPPPSAANFHHDRVRCPCGGQGSRRSVWAWFADSAPQRRLRGPIGLTRQGSGGHPARVILPGLRLEDVVWLSR